MSFNTLALFYAAEGSPLGGTIFMMVAIFAIFYFLLIRPQRQAHKRHQEMIAAVRRGDEVMTDGGILGEIVHIKEERVTIKTGENTRVVVHRPKIARVLSRGEDRE